MQISRILATRDRRQKTAIRSGARKRVLIIPGRNELFYRDSNREISPAEIPVSERRCKNPGEIQIAENSCPALVRIAGRSARSAFNWRGHLHFSQSHVDKNSELLIVFKCNTCKTRTGAISRAVRVYAGGLGNVGNRGKSIEVFFIHRNHIKV